MKIYPLVLRPIYKEYLWGGVKLKEKFNKITELDKIAESWELAVYKEDINIIENGEYAGKSLGSFIEQYPICMGQNNQNKQFPLLIKLIDSEDSLSIQVHPDDEYAMKHEKMNGKLELWYIVDCEEEARLFYGFNKEIKKEEFIAKAKDGTITDVLQSVPVKQGDVFLIDYGVVHAIGKNMTVAEIGTNCNITYRIFDFNRLDASGNPRELHLDKAEDVVKLTKPQTSCFDKNGVISCGTFQAERIQPAGSTTCFAGKDSFHHLLCVRGEGTLIYDDRTIPIKAGSSIFVPSGLGEYGLQGNAEILKTTIV